MIVPLPYYEPEYELDPVGSIDVIGGYIGGWQEPEPETDAPRRPIGFRMPDPDLVPSSPATVILDFVV